jgi:hypothetical protein
LINFSGSQLNPNSWCISVMNFQQFSYNHFILSLVEISDDFGK